MTLNVRDFGATGDGVTDDTAAFAEALAQGGRIYVPPGRFRVDFNNSGATPTGAVLISGTTLFGAGANSVISPYSAAPRAAIGCASADATSFITDISIRGIKFLGAVASAGHSEFAGLLYLTGVKRLLIADCVFEGPRGDAVTIASGFGGGPANERHNHQIIIRDSHFDGVLYGASGGRNPISVIDCDDMVIDDNSFTRWGRNDMPGGIDFEPDDSYSVIKNIRVTNNRFSLSGGNRGHVTFATENTAAANWKNCIVSDNHFESAANAAICIYSATTIGTEKNGITITNNTIDECRYVLQKVAGSVYGLIFSGNQSIATTANYGRIVIGDATSNYTVKDWLICDNILTCNTAAGNGIIDNSESVTWIGNTFRGSTQAHIIAGWGSPSTTYTSWTIVGNTFVGSPSNGTVQGDGATNALLNVYDNNKAPVGVGHSFRAVRGDVLGNSGNYLTGAAIPSAFPFGESWIRVLGDSNTPGSGDGWLVTDRRSGHSGEAILQWFTPFHSSTNAHTRFMRKAIDLSTWGTWSAAGPLKFSVSLTPASVAANTSVEEEFTVTGVQVSDVVTFSPPGHTNGILVGKARVSATNKVRIAFGNLTAGALSPPAGAYLFSVTR